MRGRRTCQVIVLGLVCLFLGGGCASRKASPSPYRATPATSKKARPATVKKALPRMGYTIQAGTFSQPENAARESALNQAEALKILGLIEAYYIVAPEEYAVSKVETLGDDYLRGEIVKAARNFLGVPYLWGGGPHRRRALIAAG